MKITFITTVNHNVGDDFVREGLKYILKKHYQSTTVEFHNIHKHVPLTTRFGFRNVRKFKKHQTLDDLLPLGVNKDLVLEADVVVQSGAPVYWCHPQVGAHCVDNEWYQPIIERRLQRNPQAQLLNLAAGSCQTYFSDGHEFCDRCNAYIRDFYEQSAVTTLRDSLAKTILNLAGYDAPVIACSSLFSNDEYKLEAQKGEYVVVNFMELAGHYSFKQSIKKNRWSSTFRQVYDELKRDHTVVFSCHDEDEKQSALKIDPAANIFISNDFVDYLKFYAKASFGLVNRVHAAFAMASFGKPSLVVGNDSRTRMLDEIGVEHLYINDVEKEMLSSKIHELQRTTTRFAEDMQTLKPQVFQKYLAELESVS